jgi:hypothetical protein
MIAKGCNVRFREVWQFVSKVRFAADLDRED